MAAHESKIRELEFPDELKQEMYERRVYNNTFDRIDLCLAFRPGKDDIGAICSHFVEAISMHDQIAKQMEEKMDEIIELRKIYNKKHRVFRNWDSSFNTMNTFQEDYQDYLQLLPKMTNYEERILEIEDPKAKAKAEAERERYLAIEGKCSGLKAVSKALFIARTMRQTSFEALTAAEKQLLLLKEEEKRLAYRITDDHVIAEERGQFIGDFFANVHIGDVLTVFCGKQVETWPFESIIKLILSQKAGQDCEFRRYDYRYDRLKGQWIPLEVMRALNVFLNDPRLGHLEFIACAGRGDKEKVVQEVLKGEDVNAKDSTHITALHLAAVNNQLHIVDYLLANGAAIDSRDRNKMTPLLSCIRRGATEMVRKLIALGADKFATDHVHRGAMFYAAGSRSIGIAKLFMAPENMNVAEMQWGWTSVHCAASKGDLEMIKMLTSNGGSIYRLSLQYKTPEDVAEECKCMEVYEYLKQLRLNAPGQLVYTDESNRASIWIGDYSALTPEWVTELGATHIFAMVKESDMATDWDTTGGLRGKRLKNAYDNKTQEEIEEEEKKWFIHEVPNCGWIRNDEYIKSKTWNIEADDDDGGHGSWERMLPQLRSIHHEIDTVMKIKKAKLLIVDESGYSTSAAVFCSWRLFVHMDRVENSVDVCTDARPSVAMCMSLRRGLEISQRALDEKKLKRLREKVRTAQMLSNAF